MTLKSPDGEELFDPLNLIGKVNTLVIRAKCPICDKENNMVVDSAKYLKWVNSEDYIQHALSEFTSSQREFLITGCCPDGVCFDEQFSDEE